MGIKQLEQTLKIDVKAALGCTEPITIALTTCHAARLVKNEIISIKVKLSTNLFKNAMEVGIPGTCGERGIPLAAALGCFSPKEKPDLTLLEGISENWLKKAKKLVDEDKVKLELASEIHGLLCDVQIKTVN